MIFCQKIGRERLRPLKFAIFGPKIPIGGTLKGYRYTSEISKISKDPGNERIGPRTKSSQNLRSKHFLEKKLEAEVFFLQKKNFSREGNDFAL